MIWLAVPLLLLFLLGGLRLRARAAALAVLPPSDLPVADGHRVLCSGGVVVDDATRRAASSYATSQGLQVLDLVPARADCAQLIGLLEMVDPRRYRDRPLAAGRTAGQAMLVTETVLRRAGGADSPFLSGEVRDAAGFLRLAEELKRCAPRQTDLAVAPGLRAVPDDLEQRRAVVRVLFGNAGGAVLMVPAVVYAAMVLLLVLRPGLGAAVLLAHHSQPLLALGGLRQLRPRGLGRALLLRLPTELYLWWRTWRGEDRPPYSPAWVEQRRAEYRQLLADGEQAFTEPRRPSCPLCGSGDLRVWLRSREFFQDKPGRFTLERCGGCGLVFQNPRLSARGLDYYYRDFYDGMGEGNLDFVFALGPGVYHARARTVEGLVEPARWLDVGGGHGHFCLTARDVWPDTRFDVLDLADSPATAERRGWADHGYRGRFPELAPELEGGYDVVSMSHYLEHTLDPVAEVAAAAAVLRPGGILLIEVPDPESPIGRLLGSYWLPWFQPQHLHLLTAGNLATVLERNGFEGVRWLRHEAHQPCECIFLLAMLAHRFSFRTDNPWIDKARWWQRAASYPVWTLAVLLFPVAGLLDLAMLPLVKPLRLSNCYRVAAVKR